MVEATTLFSGLIGVIIGMVANYFILRKIENQKKLRERQEIAYINLVKVGEIINHYLIIKRYYALIEDKIPNNFVTDIEKICSDNKISKPQLLVIVICKIMIDEQEKEKKGDENNNSLFNNIDEKDKKQAIEILKLLIECLEDMYNFEIQTNILSKLPEEALIYYDLLLKSLKSLRYTMKGWVWILDSGRKDYITPHFIYSQFILLKNIKIYSDELYKALTTFCNIGHDKAEKIRSKQFDILLKAYDENLYYKTTINETKQYLEREWGESIFVEFKDLDFASIIEQLSNKYTSRKQ